LTKIERELFREGLAKPEKKRTSSPHFIFLSKVTVKYI